MVDRRIQAVVACILCLALALVGMTIGLIVRASKNGGLRKGGEGDSTVAEDDYVFGGPWHHNNEAFPNDELDTLPVFEEETEVSRGFQLFGAGTKETTTAPIDDEATRSFRVGSELEFAFGQDGRPSSAEKELLVKETKLFLMEQVSDAWAANFVDLELDDVKFPTHVVSGVPLLSYRMKFFTKVTVRESSLQGRDDLIDLLASLDYDGVYKENYVWNAVAGDYWHVFASVTDVAYEK